MLLALLNDNSLQRSDLVLTKWRISEILACLMRNSEPSTGSFDDTSGDSTVLGTTQGEGTPFPFCTTQNVQHTYIYLHEGVVVPSLSVWPCYKLQRQIKLRSSRVVGHFLTPTLVLAIFITDPTTKKKLRGTTFLTQEFWPKAGMQTTLWHWTSLVKTLNLVLSTSRDTASHLELGTSNSRLQSKNGHGGYRDLAITQNHAQEDGGWTQNGGGNLYILT